MIGMVWADTLMGACKKSKHGRSIVTAFTSVPMCPALPPPRDRCVLIVKQNFPYVPIFLLLRMLLHAVEHTSRL
jgi:hypothetical protein